MARRHHHYDAAFEHYLRANAIPYVAVDEAKRTLHGMGGGAATAVSLKSFDFVVYASRGPNLLVDVKGRKLGGTTGKGFQNWVSREDVESLLEWQRLFGEGFDAALVFLFWCEAQPPDALFLEVFEHGGRWYAVLACRLSDYRVHMRERSKRWGTVSLPAAAFGEVAAPLKQLL